MRARNEGSIYQRKTDGRWVYARSLPTGKRVTISAATKEAVVKRRDELDAPLRESRPIPDKTLTVAGLFTLWLESQADLAPNTLILYRSLSRDHILPTLGRIRVVALTLPDCQRWLAGLKRKGLSPATCARIRQTLVACLNYGIRCRVISWNPCHDAKVTVPRTESDYLTTAEQRTLLAAARGDRLEALWCLLVGCGLRRGEALGLRRSDIDLDAGVLTVQQSLTRQGGSGVIRQPKTPGSIRVVPMPRFVVVALTEHLKRQPVVGNGLLFRTSTGTMYNPANVLLSFRRLCHRAGLDTERSRHIHETRHGYCISMLEAGQPMDLVAALIGDSLAMVSGRYGRHSRPVAQERAMAALDAALTI